MAPAGWAGAMAAFAVRSGGGGGGLRFMLELRQPAEALGQVPVALAEELHGGRQQDGADDRGVDQDRGGKPDADLLGELVAAEGEGAEDGDHHEGGARDDAGGAPEAVGDRVV